MWNGTYVTVDYLIERLYREQPFLKNRINKDEVMEFIYDAMLAIGVTLPFEFKTATLDVVDYRAELPHNILQLEGVRRTSDDAAMLKMTGLYPTTLDSLNSPGAMLAYRIEGGYIFSSIEGGEEAIEVSYKAFPIDNCGYPKVPDAPRYLKGVLSYIIERLAYRMYMADELSERKYNRIEQEWLFYVMAAANDIRLPDYDTAESWKSQMQRMISSSNHHAYGFKYLNTPEKLNTQS